MQSQDLSYDLNNEKIGLKNLSNDVTFSVEVFSLENVYVISKDSLTKKDDVYESDSLVWGDNNKVKSNIKIKNKDNKIDVTASLDKNIRSIKVRFDNLPLGKLVSTTDFDHEINEYGFNLAYPEGWRNLSHPLLVFDLGHSKFLYLRAIDKTVNKKYFFIKKTGKKTMRVDFVQEQSGTKINSIFSIPTIEYGISSSIEEIYDKQSKYMKDVYNLDCFEESKIAPSWLKDISLVTTVHMETFTGHIFHTYKKVYEDIEAISKYVNPKNILVYLAGWEGRYYYKYGCYTTDERLGGDKDLLETIEKLHHLGVKVIAMYGMNLVNKNLPGLKNIVSKAEFESIGGGKFHNGSVDWEGAHHYDFNELANLNIAAKEWQDELFRQIKLNTEKFNFDGAFLDIVACYVNDLNNSLFEGVCEFCDRLRTIKNDFLVAGEGFYDGLAKAMPLFQSGHTDGEMNYHDRNSELLFTKYVREFAHLCLGDPSRGSSGVHELGTNTLYKTPLRKGIIPTISLVENSVNPENKRFMEIMNESNEYKRLFIK